MDKQAYEAPEAKTFIIKIEGIICLSGETGVQNYNWNNVNEEILPPTNPCCPHIGE